MLKKIQCNHEVGPQLQKTAGEAFQKLKSNPSLGFLQFPSRDDEWAQILACATEIKKRTFNKLVILGIGGSSLCNLVFKEIFGLKRMVVIESLNETDLVEQLGNISENFYILISKSGRTLETLACAEWVAQTLSENNQEISDRCLVITEPVANPLFDFASNHQIKTLPVPLDVGGRFSAMTAVGLLPAAVLGLDVEAIRRGSLRSLEHSSNVIETAVFIYSSWQQSCRLTSKMAYFSRFHMMNQWWQQLWAESLAKELDRSGHRPILRTSVPVALVGPQGQHSVLQQWMAQPEDQLFMIEKFEGSRSSNSLQLKGGFVTSEFLAKNKTLSEIQDIEADSTYEALVTRKAMALKFEWGPMNEEGIGSYWMFWFLVIGTLAEMIDINAFDQPGVELGKSLANSKLKNP